MQKILDSFSSRAWCPNAPEALALAVVVVMYSAGIYLLVYIR